MLIARASSFSPDTLILAGMTLSAAFQAASVIAVSSGDPRVIILYNLLAGSTYNVGPWMAALVAASALIALAAVPLCRRWLAILPLGDAVSVGLGVRIARARFGLLILSALLSAVATLVIGPLSFIGLMAPHMARLLGIRRAMPLLYLSAVFGATLMIAGNLPGRTQTLSVAVYSAVQAGDDNTANFLVLVTSVTCVVILLLAGRLVPQHTLLSR